MLMVIPIKSKSYQNYETISTPKFTNRKFLRKIYSANILLFKLLNCKLNVYIICKFIQKSKEYYPTVEKSEKAVWNLREVQAAFYVLEGNWETLSSKKSKSLSQDVFRKLLREKSVTIETMFPGLQYPGKGKKELKSLIKALLIKFEKNGADDTFLRFRSKLPDFALEQSTNIILIIQDQE